MRLRVRISDHIYKRQVLRELEVVKRNKLQYAWHEGVVKVLAQELDLVEDFGFSNEIYNLTENRRLVVVEKAGHC